MTMRTGLYEYLSTPVLNDDLSATSTRDTRSDAETFDDDPGVGSLGTPSYGQTVITKADADTYDNDLGLDGLGWGFDVQTEITRTFTETFDNDQAVGVLGVPWPAR